jgi:hypothetical protein
LAPQHTRPFLQTCERNTIVKYNKPGGYQAFSCVWQGEIGRKQSYLVADLDRSSNPIMSTTSPQIVTQKPLRAPGGIFSSPATGGSWPTTDKDRATSELKINLLSADRPQRRITAHTFRRSPTQKSTGSFGYLVEVPSASAQNGDTKSRLREIFWQAVTSRAPRCALGTMIQSSNIGLPYLAAFAFAFPKDATVSNYPPQSYLILTLWSRFAILHPTSKSNRRKRGMPRSLGNIYEL